MVTQFTAQADKASTQGCNTGTYSTITPGTTSPCLSPVERKGNYFGPHRGEAEKLSSDSLYGDFPDVEVGVDSEGRLGPHTGVTCPMAMVVILSSLL